MSESTCTLEASSVCVVDGKGKIVCEGKIASVNQTLRLGTGGPRYRIDFSIRIEGADDPLRLLGRLNQSIQQDAVETAIMPADDVFVVLKDEFMPASQPPSCSQGSYGYHCPSSMALPLDIPYLLDMLRPPQVEGISRAKRSAS
jgi:hypothetical protein